MSVDSSRSSIFRSPIFLYGSFLSLVLMVVFAAHLAHPGWRGVFQAEAEGMLVDLPVYLDFLSLSYALLNLPVVIFVGWIGPALAAAGGLSRWGAFLLENLLAALLSPVWWLAVAAVFRKIPHRRAAVDDLNIFPPE